MKSHRSLVWVFITALGLVVVSGFFLSALNSGDSEGAVQRGKAEARIALRQIGRTTPGINLRDGGELQPIYSGAEELKRALEKGLARPAALASADFDEDGVPDLASGYLGPKGGILTVRRGNVDSIYPNSPEAQQRKARGEFSKSPFLSQASVFEVPEAPDLLGTGDFDADGHADVIAAARGSDKLYFLPGDARGGLGRAQPIELPGRVTALEIGEINRAEGLPDVVVGIMGANGPEVLVFESAEGAIKAKPEVFPLPAEATALALGQLDEDYPMDLAVAAGHELVILHGRDRRLSLDEARRAEVPPAAITFLRQQIH